ncbi:uncharacterized protein LOC125957191 isoform X2 [Anopheles darlingi]|uniref:uncharacterized protein LOC125957191 isoform X2 n=1 Tax=Anopheles darlingi TaxID=43151 RepID=UPI0021001B95|nr:uncharacterized protein LOC125957191 isoform X2 [Anopheles darlingi]
MASLDSETPIDSLPEEVLCMIFDRLNLRNVKTASLTCRRWHDIIFSSAYVNRFKLEIRFEWSTIAEKCAEWSPRQMKKMIDTLKHTQRFHRNMSLRISHTLTDNDFQAFWECFHPRVTEHINSLQLDIMSCSSQLAILAILNGITLMPKLRSLSFDNCSSPYYNLPILRNATINHLKMRDLCVFPFDMPELQSFEGPASALAQPNQPLVYNNLKHITITELLMFYRTIPTRWAHVHMPEIQSFQGPLYALAQLDTIAQPKVFAKLKRVTLTDCLMRFENKSSLHRLARVETLHLSIDAINDWFLPAVCEACPALQHLYFDYPWLDIYPATLRQLSKFVNLRHLVISSIETSYTLAVGFDYGLSQLTQLELLDLGSHILQDPSLKHLPKSIRSLTVHITSANEASVIETITGTLTQLKKLRLIYPGRQPFSAPAATLIVDKQTLKLLHLLAQLEVLVFDNVKFTESAFLDMEAPMHQMRELLFVRCDLDRNHIRGCREMFPNLKKIVFRRKLQTYYFSNQIQ